MLLMEASGKTKVRKLDVSVLVNKDIVRFDITAVKRSREERQSVAVP